MNSLQALDFRQPIGNINAYITYVNQIPMLAQDEELEFANRLQKQNDLTAAKQLVLPHLRYVVKIAKNYLGYGLPLNDLIQEGNIGLLKAVKRFNPALGVRLVTFATHWIKSEIHEFILRNWRIVKIATTKAQRKLFFNLRSMKKQLSWMSDAEVQDMANDLKVKPETVREMEMRLSASDAVLETYSDEEEHSTFVPTAYLEDQRYNPATQLENSNWSEQSSSTIQEALKKLDTRSQEIIHARWLDEKNKLTLQELADTYQVSAERIRQLEKNALQKLKVALEEI